jgi:hypothetical protein
MPKKSKKFVKGKSVMATQAPRWIVPPPILSTPIYSKTFRYLSTNAESKDADYVTMGSLQNLMYVGGSSMSTGVGFMSAVRVKKVEIWGLSGASTFGTVGINWIGEHCPNKEHIATGNSVYPAHIVSRPPKNSVASFWYNGQLPGDSSVPANTPYAFSLQCTASDIVDVTIDYTIFDNTSLNNPFVVTSAGLTPGLLFYNTYLDNTSVSLGVGTRNFAIQGVSTLSAGFISAW